jgi:protein-S-isoprenylcysteine O-methyltransferase Ste14
MNPWFGKAAVLGVFIAYIAIRAPHGHRSRNIGIAEDRKGALEIALLLGATLGATLLPILWVATGFPARADYPLHPVPYGLGVAMAVGALWLFHRSHADLGTNWSITLQTRENHNLVTNGVYRRIRHPMYASFFLLGIAHVLFVPNWIVGPVYLLSFGVLYLLRVGREERMMRDRFGRDYDDYMRRSGRLWPV